jgi:hypothetical protein
MIEVAITRPRKLRRLVGCIKAAGEQIVSAAEIAGIAKTGARPGNSE